MFYAALLPRIRLLLEYRPLELGHAAIQANCSTALEHNQHWLLYIVIIQTNQGIMHPQQEKIGL